MFFWAEIAVWIRSLARLRKLYSHSYLATSHLTIHVQCQRFLPLQKSHDFSAEDKQKKSILKKINLYDSSQSFRFSPSFPDLVCFDSSTQEPWKCEVQNHEQRCIIWRAPRAHSGHIVHTEEVHTQSYANQKLQLSETMLEIMTAVYQNKSGQLGMLSPRLCW